MRVKTATKHKLWIINSRQGIARIPVDMLSLEKQIVVSNTDVRKGQGEVLRDFETLANVIDASYYDLLPSHVLELMFDTKDMLHEYLDKHEAALSHIGLVFETKDFETREKFLPHMIDALVEEARENKDSALQKDGAVASKIISDVSSENASRQVKRKIMVEITQTTSNTELA